ncbi:MAG TPA: substrate-binding domain-containing protein, partial [Bacillota bacterium]|nr:substrate-binding domain-containing protein [Bacillota bacterium]
FMTEHGINEYQSRMMIGVFEAAQKHNINIIRFAARYLHNIFNYELEKLYEIIKLHDIDGLLFLGWMTGITRDNLQSFRKHFHHIPIVSLGACYEDIPNVYMDGSYYIRELLIHLIKGHGYQRIVFIPPYIPDDRVSCYENTLKEYGLFRPELSIDGRLLQTTRFEERATKAISILLDERKTSFDAIMTMYQDDARHLLPDLIRRGFRVPEDIALTSYEDSEAARYSIPSLTTIHYPWREVGFHGCEKLIELLQTGYTSPSTKVPSKLIIRNSCGCLPSYVNIAKAGPIEPAAHSFQEISAAELSHIGAQIQTVFPDLENRGLDIMNLLEALVRDYHEQTFLYFVNELQKQLTQSILNYRDIEGIDDVIYYLRNKVLPYLVHSNQNLAWGEDIFSQAQAIVKENVIIGLGRYQLLQKYQTHELQQIGKELITTFDIKKLTELLEQSLQKVGIRSCFMFLFEGDHHYENCRLILEYCDNQRAIIDEEMVNVPEYLERKVYSQERRMALLAQLLNVNEEFVGMIIFEPGPMDERVYSLLSIELSAALRGAILLTNLADTKQELIETAHRAGMADIAVGTLHNIGNVLNSINTSVQLIHDMLENSPIDDINKASDLLAKNMETIEDFICNDLKGKKLLQFILKLNESLHDLKEQSLYHVKRLEEKTNLIGEIIIEQQNYAGAKKITEELNLNEALEDALTIQATSLEKAQIQVTKNFRDVVRVPVQKTKLMQILINLLNNAKDALSETPVDQRRIILTIESENTTAYLKCTDSGCGVSPELLKTMFNLGFTTKKTGHGFGLHSCANFMAEMGGKVWAESPGRGQGTSIVLQFELQKK